MKYARKISLDFIETVLENSVTDIRILNGKQKFMRYFPKVDKVWPEYKSLDEESGNKLVDALPEYLKTLEKPRPALMHMPASNKKNPHFLPHVDAVRTVALNIYIKANEEKTSFYEHDENGLYETESFVAETGDCWILNVSQPHSVKLTTNSDRLMYTFSYGHITYKELIEECDKKFLEETKYL